MHHDLKCVFPSKVADLASWKKVKVRPSDLRYTIQRIHSNRWTFERTFPERNIPSRGRLCKMFKNQRRMFALAMLVVCLYDSCGCEDGQNWVCFGVFSWTKMSDSCLLIRSKTKLFRECCCWWRRTKNINRKQKTLSIFVFERVQERERERELA